MANAKKDENHVSTLTGVLDSDGSTITLIKVDVNRNRLKVSDGTGGSDNGPTNAKMDENHIPTLIAVSSTDGTTPVVVYADSNGALLVNRM